MLECVSMKKVIFGVTLNLEAVSEAHLADISLQEVWLALQKQRAF